MGFKKLSARLGLEEHEFAELVEILIKTAGEDIEKIQTAFDKGDFETMAEAAHSLKGAAGNLGYLEIFKIAEAIEKNARENNPGDSGTAIPLLQDRIDDLKEQIKDFLNR